ncbi:hypothetical protein [Foetidibacter luteolus]|uniref:hypothetical protein n=1 Tax=Foetidibacter luteolus TaxID=2608880 RepID=UPI00129B77CE|nr:hypothetical protein [Foetidibacter luteolus]
MEKEVIQNVVSESYKYGLAVTILVVLNIALSAFIFFMWKQTIKEKNELVEVIKENTAAFTSLQGTINQLQGTITTLIQLIRK